LEFRLNGVFQHLLFLWREVCSLVLVVKRHQPNLLVRRKEVVDDAQPASSAFSTELSEAACPWHQVASFWINRKQKLQPPVLIIR
jgi:hypothetical protein